MTKAKFDIVGTMKKISSGRVTVSLVDFPENEEGVKTVYNVIKSPKGSAFERIIEVDKETFAPANEKVVKALYYICLADKVLSKNGKKILDDFIDRKGTFSKLADAEHKENIRNVLKSLKGVQLEVLDMVAEALSKDTDGNLTDILAEEIINYEIN